MSITRKKHWMFVASVAGTLALAACSPPPQPAADDATAPSVAEAPAAPAPTVKSIDALSGLKIVQFGPTSVKAHAPGDGKADERLDIWVQGDRNLDGYEAALWLDGKPLENPAISGTTVTGSIPVSALAVKGTFPLEIRIGEDGSKLTSEKVNFVVE